MTEYDIQAAEFLKKAETNMTISRTGEIKGFPFDDHDTLWHYKYQVTLTRHKKQYRFTFYDSHNNWLNNKRPSLYDVRACLEKYEIPYGVYEFAREYGYEIDEIDSKEYKRVKKIRDACEEQYDRLYDLFGEELMQELCQIN